MAYADVTVTSSTTITAADLNQMRANAQHLRDDLVGRVLAQSPTTLTDPLSAVTRMRLRFDVGSLTWFSDWTSSPVYVPLPGAVTNLDAGGLTGGRTDLVITAEQERPGVYQITELTRLAMFISADVKRLSFFGEVKIGSGGGFARALTAVGSYGTGLTAPA